MRLGGDRIAALLDHGLTEHQARVYLALLEFPSLAAGTLAKSANVPRNRLYEVLEELQTLGLVEIILGTTRAYRALPFVNHLDRSVAALRDRLDRIEAQRAYLAKTFTPPDLMDASHLDAGSTRAVLSRRAVAREADRIVADASTSLVVEGSQGGWERVIHHLTPRVRDGLDKLDLRVILPRSAALQGGAERMGEEAYARVRWTHVPLDCLCFVGDGKEMLLIHPIPDDRDPRRGHDLALLTTNPAFLREHVALLHAVASRASTE